MATKPTINQSTKLSDLYFGKVPSLSSLFPTSSGSTPSSIINVVKAPVANVAPKVVVPAPVQAMTPLPVQKTAANAGPLFSGNTGGSMNTAGPVGPVSSGGTGNMNAQGGAGAQGGSLPSQWMKADGSFYTPEEIAQGITSHMAATSGGPDIGNLTRSEFGGANTTQNLQANAANINNTRNDIAVGATDPYGVASKSGIAYTPAELNAIEKAYSGIYDPALDTALSKLQSSQDADKQAAADKAASDRIKLTADLDAKKPYTLGKDDIRYDSDGNPIAVGSSSGSTGSATYVAGQDPTADAYVQGFISGTYKASDIPDAYKGIVAQGVAQGSGSNAPISKTSTDAIGIINQLQGLNNLDKLSGNGIIGSIEHPSSLFPGTDVQNAQNLAKQLQATLSLANRTQLKGQGAISDFEFKVLGDAASALGLDDKGRTNLSADQFKDQLNKLKVRLAVGQTKNITDDEVQYLSTQGYSPDDIKTYDQSFKSVGNTKASTQKNRPQKNNNPGNVKGGGVADALAVGKDDQGHLVFPNAIAGFKALTLDLTAKVNGASKYLPKNPTIAQLGKVYAEDPKWATSVAKILGVSPSTTTLSIPITQLAQAVAKQEGFYA